MSRYATPTSRASQHQHGEHEPAARMALRAFAGADGRPLCAAELELGLELRLVCPVDRIDAGPRTLAPSSGLPHRAIVLRRSASRRGVKRPSPRTWTSPPVQETPGNSMICRLDGYPAPPARLAPVGRYRPLRGPSLGARRADRARPPRRRRHRRVVVRERPRGGRGVGGGRRRRPGRALRAASRLVAEPRRAAGAGSRPVARHRHQRRQRGRRRDDDRRRRARSARRRRRGARRG